MNVFLNNDFNIYFIKTVVTYKINKIVSQGIMKKK